MNAVKGLFGKLRAAVPKGAGGAPGGGVPAGAGAGVSVLVALGLGTYGAYHSMVTIQPGHKGVVYNRFGGLDDKHILREGLNFVVPWFQRPIVFDVRTRPQPIDTTSGSKGTATFGNFSSPCDTLCDVLLSQFSVFHFRLANGNDIIACAVQARPQ